MPVRPHTTRGFATVVAVSLVVYWLTAYPTITWWDSSQYSLAAATLGVTAPPGSLLLPLLGWVVTRLPLGLPVARVLNLFAGLLAALATGLVYLVALRLIRLAGRRDGRGNHPDLLAHAGAAVGALTLAFGVTLWQHAVKFTPYVLTVVFTGMIFWVMLRWWEDAEHDDAWRWLPILGLLFGLDFSVHRTNALLLPGLCVWIVVRHPRTLASLRAWLCGVGGVVAGLALQLLIIPLAARHPFLNMSDPSNWRRFWNYVSLQQQGGHFLVQFFPRNAPFWTVQVWDVVRAFGANFFGVTGPLGALGALPGLFGILGMVLLWRRHRRLGTALAALIFVHAAVTILYFNIPANFFRPFTRHYLPIFVPFSAAIGYGLYATLRWVADLNWNRDWSAVVLSALLLAPAPVAQLTHNWAAVDGSDHHFAEDYATNTLRGLPRDAILFTNGDNDTFPLWYVQVVEGVRPDVSVVNLPLSNAAWYVDQLAEWEPALPLPQSAEERRTLTARSWSDTTITIPVTGTPEQLGLPSDATVPEAITLHATPRQGGNIVYGQDLVLLRIVEDNHWRRPLIFGMGVTQQNYAWLEPYRRVDGAFARVVPIANPPADIPTLRRNLLERYTYRGYADERVRLEDVSRSMGQVYFAGFRSLAEAESARGEADRCRQTRDAFFRLLPPARLTPDAAAPSPGTTFCSE